MKLQRHSLDTSHALDQSHALQRQNSRLQEEIESLRENPDVTPDPTAQQVSELTLALRRLSDKLTAIEETLADRTTELAHARSDLAKVQPDIAAANDLASQYRLQVQEARARERELQRKVQVAEEERRLSDLVVQEYADLVRTLEGRKSKSTPPLASVDSSASSSSTTLADSLAEGKLGLRKLLGEHGGEAEHLASEVTRLHSENELLKAKLDVERNRSEADRESLARVLLELDKYKADDSTATKMVSRYMFVQALCLKRCAEMYVQEVFAVDNRFFATSHGQPSYSKQCNFDDSAIPNRPITQSFDCRTNRGGQAP